MKDPRNPRTWSNVQIEQDPDGYVLAQEAFRQDREEARRQARESDDLRRFTEAYVAAGGRRSEAASAFTEQRDQRAAESASRAETSILQDARRRVRRAL